MSKFLKDLLSKEINKIGAPLSAVMPTHIDQYLDLLKA